MRLYGDWAHRLWSQRSHGSNPRPSTPYLCPHTSHGAALGLSFLITLHWALQKLTLRQGLGCQWFIWEVSPGSINGRISQGKEKGKGCFNWHCGQLGLSRAGGPRRMRLRMIVMGKLDCLTTAPRLSEPEGTAPEAVSDWQLRTVLCGLSQLG